MRGLRTGLVAMLCVLSAFPAQAAVRPQAGSGDDRPVRVGPELHQSGTSTVLPDDRDARAIHRELDDVMKRYPPALGQILRLDPTLMSNPTYLAPYPALQAFLAAHPDVLKNPGYYFNGYGGGDYQPESPSQRMIHDLLDGAGGLAIFGTIMAVLIWLVRLLVDYRRWNRLAKVQAEAHTKLLDRFTANDELIAYVQSPAGSQFLQSAPIALDPGTRRLGAPVSRILWSAQAGLVILMAGLGFQYVSGRVDPDAAQALFAIGVVAFAVGVGFLLSAGVSYALSQRLGLFEAPPANSSAPHRAPEA